MRTAPLLGLVATAWLAVAPSGARAQGVLEPPFGLRWGDSPEKLVAWASRHSLDVNIFLPGDQPPLRILRISPRKGFLPGTSAEAVEARFHTGHLYEVTVHYADPEASADTMEDRFLNLKRQATAEYGELAANQQQKTVDDQFATRTLSFHREPVKGLFLLLAFTEVEDLLRKSKGARFSLLYRNDNLRLEWERKAAEQPPPLPAP